MNDLTPTETGVLYSLADGLTQTEIAAERFISTQTVKTHCASLREKLGAKTNAQAVANAYHRRIFVVPGGPA